MYGFEAFSPSPMIYSAPTPATDFNNPSYSVNQHSYTTPVYTLPPQQLSYQVAATQLISVSKTLVISIQYSSYPINEELLHQVFSPYGSVEIIRICTVDDCTSVILQYQSIDSAIAAHHNLQGQCIYASCCQMHIQFLNVEWNPIIELMIKHGRNSCLSEEIFSDLENTSTTDVISENLQLEENELFAPAVFDEMLDSDDNDYSMDEQVQYDHYEDDDKEVNSSFIIADGTINWTIPDITSSVGESDFSSTKLQLHGISNCHPNIEIDTCISEIVDMDREVTSSISDSAKFDFSELEEKHFDTPEVLYKLSDRENDDYPLANKVLYDGYGVDDQTLGGAKLNSMFEIDIPYGSDNFEVEILLESSPLLSFAAIVDKFSYLTLILLLIKGLTSVANTTSFLVILDNFSTEIPPLPPDELDNETQEVAQGEYRNFMKHHTDEMQLQMFVADFDELICKSSGAWNTIESGSLNSTNRSRFQPEIFIILLHEKYFGSRSGTSNQPDSDTQRLDELCLSVDSEHSDCSLSKQHWVKKVTDDQASLGSYAKRYVAHSELKTVYSRLFAALWECINTSEIGDGNNQFDALAKKGGLEASMSRMDGDNYGNPWDPGISCQSKLESRSVKTLKPCFLPARCHQYVEVELLYGFYSRCRTFVFTLDNSFLASLSYLGTSMFLERGKGVGSHQYSGDQVLKGKAVLILEDKDLKGKALS